MADEQKINMLAWQMMRAKSNDERMRIAESMDGDVRAAVLQKMADLSLSMIAAGDMDWLVLGDFLLDVAFESDNTEEFIDQLDEEHQSLVWMAMIYRTLEALGFEHKSGRMKTLHWVLLAMAIVIVAVTVIVFWL